MSSLSKTSVPSLVDMITSRNPFQVPMLKSNTRWCKQARCLINSDNLNVVSSPVQRSGTPVAYSHQKKCETLVPKGVLDSNPLQKSNGREEHEFSKWMVRFMLLIVNYLLKHHAEMTYIMSALMVQNMFGVLDSQKPATLDQLFLPVSLQMIFKYPGRFFRKIRKALDTSFHQMPTEASGFSKHTENLRVSFEISAILDQFNLQMPSKTRVLKNAEQIKLSEVRVWVTEPIFEPKSLITDTNQLRHEMKRLKMCFWCQEKIADKKFFSERRYCILSNCDCMICYGCIKKTVEPEWVKKPVVCPVCSVESDTYASYHKWIEGQEKLDFFQTYIKNMETFEEARKVGLDMMGERMYSEPQDEQSSNFTKSLAHIFI